MDYGIYNQKEILQLRGKVLQAEQERLKEAETISISEAKRRCRKRLLHISKEKVDENGSDN